METVHEARWFRREGDRLVCTLCPRLCRLRDGQAGFCTVRENRGGRMVLLGYGRSSGFAVDPIEKKPLNHYYPGSSILSFGGVGCNLGCRFCQNWNISKTGLDDALPEENTPDDVAAAAVAEGCPSIAYTYNDPVISAEYVIDVQAAAHRRGLHNVQVTAGYVSPEPRTELYRDTDAANVDLKGFTDEFYRKLAFARLDPVLDTLEWIVKQTRVWLEVTTLLIPGLNDSDDELGRMTAWYREHLGADVPLHFTAFHPSFRMMDVPATPPATLRRARAIAQRAGLNFVYVGNVSDPDGQTTTCPRCGKPVIVRDWYAIRHYALDRGNCAGCGQPIPGRWPDEPVMPRDQLRRYRVSI